MLRGKVCLDVGTSTEDLLIAFAHGAARVIAVDTGYGQIDFRSVGTLASAYGKNQRPLSHAATGRRRRRSDRDGCLVHLRDAGSASR